jgi:peptidoglycan/LPS O-acetylase OafA/YrhL
MATAIQETSRFAAIDLLKAAGIVAVVWIHAFLKWGAPHPEAIERIGYLTRFAVPGFLFAAGFLQAAGPRMSPRELVTKRLARILLPYLVASVAAFSFRAFVLAEPCSFRRITVELATGGAWGIFYFVPVLVGATLLGEWLFRYPRLAWPVFLTFWGLGLLSETRVIALSSLWLDFRSPLRWWGYFFAGWVAARNREWIGGLPCATRMHVGTVAAAAAVVAFAWYLFLLPPGWSPVSVTLQYVMIYGIVLGVVFWWWQAPDRPWLRWLSEATYPIYLYHYFVIVLMERMPASFARDMASFAAAAAASVLLVGVARRLMGRPARLVLG